MTEDRSEFFQLDNGLSDREVLLIGQIIVQWGALEHEIFTQIALTFDDGTDEALPDTLNNVQFTKMLGLWRERVVNRAQEERADVLRREFDEMARLKEFRDALVHGMWHWSAAELTRISTVRVRKKQVITTHFTVNDLQDFAKRLASVNFKIRYPGGVEELAQARAERGYGVGRMGLAMLTGVQISDDWLSARPLRKSEKQE